MSNGEKIHSCELKLFKITRDCSQLTKHLEEEGFCLVFTSVHKQWDIKVLHKKKGIRNVPKVVILFMERPLASC